MCKKIHRGGNAEQYHADKKYKEAVAEAVEACADDTKGQTCYIWYGCPAACGTTCTDSGEWHKKGDDEKDCAWVASHPSEARCLVRGEDDTLAKDACPSACAPQ